MMQMQEKDMGLNLYYEIYMDSGWRWRLTDGTWVCAKSERAYSTQFEAESSIDVVIENTKLGNVDVFYNGKGKDTWNYVTFNDAVIAYVTVPMHPDIYLNSAEIPAQRGIKHILHMLASGVPPREIPEGPKQVKP